MSLRTLRWHIAGRLICLGFWIAPRGKARDLYYTALLAVSGDIIKAITSTHPRDQKERT